MVLEHLQGIVNSVCIANKLPKKSIPRVKLEKFDIPLTGEMQISNTLCLGGELLEDIVKNRDNDVTKVTVRGITVTYKKLYDTALMWLIGHELVHFFKYDLYGISGLFSTMLSTTNRSIRILTEIRADVQGFEIMYKAGLLQVESISDLDICGLFLRESKDKFSKFTCHLQGYLTKEERMSVFKKIIEKEYFEENFGFNLDTVIQHDVCSYVKWLNLSSCFKRGEKKLRSKNKNTRLWAQNWILFLDFFMHR